jgi:putative thioredoxin
MATTTDIFHATQDNFEVDVLEASFTTPVLVDFWAPWCGPCKTLMPMLDKIVTESRGAVKLAKVNTDEEMALAGSFGIRSLPTVVLFKDGRPVDGFMGAQPEGAVRALLAKHLSAQPAAPEPELEPEEAELEAEDLASVIAGLQAAIKADPKKHELKAELADALLRGGLLDEGTAALDQLPSEVQDHDVSRRARARLGFLQAIEHAPNDGELQADIARDGGNLLARYQLGARFLLAGQYAAGMDQFLTILKADRKFADDLGRRALVDAFRIVPDADLVGDYRRRMTSLLF